MTKTTVIQYVTRDEYMEHAISRESYKDAFKRKLKGDYDCIQDMISSTIDYYNDKYGGSEVMRFALVEQVSDGVKRELICYGFDEVDEYGNECFYPCC